MWPSRYNSKLDSRSKGLKFKSHYRLYVQVLGKLLPPCCLCPTSINGYMVELKMSNCSDWLKLWKMHWILPSANETVKSVFQYQGCILYRPLNLRGYLENTHVHLHFIYFYIFSQVLCRDLLKETELVNCIIFIIDLHGMCPVSQRVINSNWPIKITFLVW